MNRESVKRLTPPGEQAPRHTVYPKGTGAHAFSLLQMIGFLAVISILAAALAPSFVGQMDKTAGDQESATLKRFGEALQQNIMRTRYIPGTSDWASNIAVEVGADVASITTSPRKQKRVFVIDPNLSIGGAGLPYAQTSAGATGVTNARLMLVSSIGRALPGSIVTGASLSATDFTNVWNWNDANKILPSTSFSWTGWPSSDDLRVQRIDLSALFSRLVLSTFASSCCPSYAIDTNTPAAVPATKYFIQNSVLNLYNGPPAFSLDSQQILIQNSAFVYYLDNWRGSVSGAPLIAGVDIAAVVDQYMSAYPNARAQNGTNQQAVVVQSMMAFMDAYTAWAASGFSYTPAGGQSTAPDYVVNAEANMRAALQGQYLQNLNVKNGQPCCDPVQTLCQ